MSTDRLANQIKEAREALRSYLATLTGSDARFTIDEAAEADLTGAAERTAQAIVFWVGASAERRWAVVLDRAWLPLLSKSMLGEPIEFGDPGANDLLKELSAQAFAAVRTQLAAAGDELPEPNIRLKEDDQELNQLGFADALQEIPFRLEVDDQTLSGFAIVPTHPAGGNPEKTEVPSAGARDGAASDAKDAASAGIATDVATPPSAGPSTVQVKPAAFPDLGGETLLGDDGIPGFELLAEVELEVTVELGRRGIPLADVLRLTTGSVIELEKLVGEPLEVYANGRLIAEGEAVVMDEQFGIRITNLISTRARAKAFV